MDMELKQEAKKQYKTFKEYYSDPEYKAKHLAYVKAKIVCPVCNKLVSRSNLGHHNKTEIHKKRAEVLKNSKPKPDIKKVKELIKQLESFL
jgi:hypothetical protein